MHIFMLVIVSKFVEERSGRGY